MSEQPLESEQVAAEPEEQQAVEDDLDALLSDVKRERDEYLALAQRAKADFENYRKRAARESTDAERRGRASLVRDLVPAIDNLERALRVVGIDPNARRTVDGEAPSEEVSAQEALARGLALVYQELHAALGRAGVLSYDPAGERFDPASSEAVSTRPAIDGVEAGTVVETLERGYRVGEQVLRPARVIVAE
jgi:molecular chaperone GrpE